MYLRTCGRSVPFRNRKSTNIFGESQIFTIFLKIANLQFLQNTAQFCLKTVTNLNSCLFIGFLCYLRYTFELEHYYMLYL
jgi:hypothetical protein